MKFKAILIGALVPSGDGKGGMKPWGVFTQTAVEAERMGKAVLEGLSKEDQAVARVKVVATKEVTIAEIHVAADQPVWVGREEGKQRPELVFAIARHEW